MYASLKRGQIVMLPREFRNESLQNTVCMAREEVVRMLTTLGSIKSVAVKQLLKRHGLDSVRAIGDEYVVVWYCSFNYAIK